MSSNGIFKGIVTGSGFVDTLSNLIIRPPRAEYNMNDLTQVIFSFEDDPESNRYWRKDLKLENMRGLTIHCSWYKPMLLDEYGAPKSIPLPCVIYCHANCGSRVDAAEALCVLRNGFSFFTFDFCGSGKSDGEYISLGHYERQDLIAVVEYLSNQADEVSSIAMWGRSMGAVTAIMYASKDPSISCIVCDSPFSSLHELIEDIVSQHTGRASCCIPNPFKRSAVKAIRNRVAKRASFDINEIDTLKYAKDCKVPVMLIHGEDDDFVPPDHTERLSRVLQNTCVRHLVPGGHNDERNMHTKELIIDFLMKHCTEKSKQEDGERVEGSDTEDFTCLSNIEVQDDIILRPVQVLKPRLKKES